jgi:hypothetical protein
MGAAALPVGSGTTTINHPNIGFVLFLELVDIGNPYFPLVISKSRVRVSR